MRSVEEITSLDDRLAGELGELLRDSVANGASVGYLLPLPDAQVSQYWKGVAAELDAGEKHLLILRDAGGVAGTVQLGLCMKPNGMHRAEVQKLLVHSRCRRMGYGRVLMEAVETLARRIGRTLLVLDTEAGSPAQILYESHGYQLLGVLPRYAGTPDGALKPCAFFYREL